MLKTYRIIKKEFLKAPHGEGAFKFGGRWNNSGEVVVYSSETKALATLEILVNIQIAKNLKFYMVSIHIPNNISKETIHLNSLPKKWRIYPSITVSIGSQWIKNTASCVLKVPSSIIPDEFNYLINPNHKDYKKIKFLEPEKFCFDERFL
ncbi:hypothetical protein MNBD_UNCLBAC01-1725 [hydrothermal vent metagenome]|uniref:RES domain-containing protein n=1 Tax=hydrothermal vent metagenome TaxID=652676 RepID=A0A3B1E0Z7_9ZZZZ